MADKQEEVGFRRPASRSIGFPAALPSESLTSIFVAQTGLADSIAAMMPKFNLAEIANAASISAALATENTKWISSIHALMRKIDVTALSGMAEISRSLADQNMRWLATIQPALPKIEIPSLAPFVAPWWFDGLREIVNAQISGVLSGVDWDQLRRRMLVPENWPTEFEDYLPMIEEALNAEGLPLAWVPRREVFLRLVTATTAEERLEILREHRDEVLEDCGKIIENLEDDFMAPQIPLAREAVSACKAGHWRVAAVSAVVIVHSVVENLEWSTNPQGLMKNHGFAAPSTLEELIERATRAPFVSFYVEWHPKSGKPQPRGLARNMVSHRVTDTHLDEHNCLIAVMLMASLMETVNQLGLGRPAVEAA
ncbi:hypothetical protein E3O06_11820 [Cryobacterium glaciale]|uniref:Uncharacterized protein n=1 Tax=Cryobacterium glaciale TaxID=1259145 RepID=A0A4R8UVZ0_9MICO|nr:hypothetical protein [Cryobacterium glaciale]TFB71526.1 hypothetical protein E3O06_11820 [Cryobacterium glaciale]